MKKTQYIKFSLCIILSFFIFFSNTSEAKAASANEIKNASKVFDATYYAQRYPDVVAAVGNSKEALLKHYLDCGINEGRNASANFNATVYKNRYSDLASAFGDDMIRYASHYVTNGQKEGRSGKPDDNLTNITKNTDQTNSDYQFLGSYTTKYNAKEARATNVGLAASHINGVVVQPGVEFSFSNTVGPRTVENGFVEATVYINKEHAKGIGGGVCQVSSTLYATMKTIGLPATERHPHSLPVSYLPEGWDATISGTSLDLKFVNIYDRPLLITASADNGKLTISLYLKNKK